MSPFFDVEIPYYPQILSGQFSQAVDHGLSLLESIKQSEPAKYSDEPKGTPFYLLGIAAFASHDYQTATFFFDAAVSEDLKHYPGDDNKPALLFMLLNDTIKEQAALQVVRIVVARLNQALDDYNKRKGSKHLELEHVRAHFLKHVLETKEHHLRSLTSTFVSFLAEWDYRLKMIDLSEAGSREPFLTHLFRGCLLFESLLKENPCRPVRKKTASLGDVINTDLFDALGIDKIKRSSHTLESVLQSLGPNESLQEAIQCTAHARNTLAHNVAWAVQSLNREKYDLLAKNIASACLHAISTLYRTQLI
jgi:hypothetical protein